MKALLLKQYMELEYTDMPDPAIGDDDVLIRVGACGICGSDIHGMDGSSGRRIPPLIMGHEASGTIVETGRGAGKWKAGDRVTFDSMISCGKCHFCRAGNINLCESRQVLGVSCGDYRRHGAFAEYLSVPQNILYRLSDAVPFEHAAMIEPISIAVHAANLTPIRMGDTALVVGTGMIGLLTVQAARVAGCTRVFAVDLDDTKLALARKLGADETFNPRTDDVVKAIQDRTDGRGADVAFEAVGATDPIKTAIAACRKGGTVTLIGNITQKVELPLQQVVTREIRLQGTCGSSGEYPACIDLLARGLIQVEPFISAQVPLSDGAQWFERLYKHEPNLMKVILRP
ncbi:MAG: galactitol-1-phosphate 5-dehydrogenase [Candidatus Solibacter usitatus]|nr:galactitol-1-phosphate 5-dehydrogenase [Candidatus Solibacter usitatus]